MTSNLPDATRLAEIAATMRDPADLKERIAAAQARYDAMSPLERAIHDMDQKRSGMRGLAKMSTPNEVIDAQIDKMPEYIVLKAYRDLSRRLALAKELAAELRQFIPNHKCDAEDGLPCSKCGRSETELPRIERIVAALRRWEEESGGASAPDTRGEK